MLLTFTIHTTFSEPHTTAERTTSAAAAAMFRDFNFYSKIKIKTVKQRRRQDNNHSIIITIATAKYIQSL